MRFGSLFAGIGGIDLGLERSGMECAFQVEWDDYATRVLEKHWPNVPRWRDIREVETDDLPAVDLLAGGFPCQPHSLAGKRQASADERDLWGEFVRLIRGTRPQWVVAENVPGLLSSEAGRYFGRVLGDLAELGFDAEWRVLSAAGMGAPHLRRRIFIVAYAPSLGRGKGRPESEGQQGLFGVAGCGDPVGDPDGKGQLQPQGLVLEGRGWLGDPGWWASEPDVGRVANGVPARVDRLKCLGNAVVPQCAEYIGRLIMAADQP